MPTDQRAALKKIRTFPMLVRYLREEMGWPIDGEDFDEITFEYTAEELGIDAKNAAKIEEIKRLRPLLARQPWGIFFVKFEPKRLPVVALRRILSQVVVKKRASSNHADRVSWKASDLLFISNYGEGEERRISFAHFAQNEAKKDLPTLKVLGWDNLDTALHLDHVADKLTHNLAWPEEDDINGWRKSWSSAFTLRHGEVIITSRDLSVRLAELARAIRDRIRSALAIETETGPLTKLMKAFQEALVHDLDVASFADMYAQTIAYGLLSARITNPKDGTADDLLAQLPVTNPFLKELLETFLHVGGRRGKAGGPGIDFDELGVSEVVELLDNSNMEAVIRDFGDRNPQEDPVIHFYEGFAREYDPIDKVRRGEFYTPRPIVSYIVRSVDELLRTEFGLADGLADTTTWGEMAERHPNLKIPEGVAPARDFVQILDPATGTGTFLVEVIDTIYRTVKEKWEKEAGGPLLADVSGRWNEYVPKHLLSRLHAYELKMAPYAIAHLNFGLKLYETGYRFGSDQRARVYLTNALEPPSDKQLSMDFLPALAHEAQAVNAIKRKRRFTVVVGNPPYAKLSSNRSEAAEALVKPFKEEVREERNIQPLSDDYLKFLGLALAVSETVPRFALGMITNRGYLNGLIHRGARHVISSSWQRLWLVDLHGDSNVGERSPNGAMNENVFDIQQGVAITIGLKTASASASAAVKRYDAWGTRDDKQSRLEMLAPSASSWTVCDPKCPHFFFAPQTDTSGEMERSFPLCEIMPTTNTGIKTHRDHLVIDFDSSVLGDRMQRFVDAKTADACARSEFFGVEARGRYKPGDNRDWSMSAARRQLQSLNRPLIEFIRELEYRPFDRRFVFYSSAAIDFAREELMRHIEGGQNIGLVATRQVPNGEFCHVFVTRQLIEMKTASHDRGTNLFPLWLRHDLTAMDVGPALRPNLSALFLEELSRAFGLRRAGENGLPKGVSPEGILGFIYAVLHSPSYRSRYAHSLRIDFPRIPIPGRLSLFRNLTRLGSELIALHLMESPRPRLGDFVGTYTGSKKAKVGRVGWSDGTVWLDACKTSARERHRATKPGTIGFHYVPEQVWDFHIGGYQVCHKWLKDRKGRTLSEDDIAHYQKIVVALNETVRIMREIDEVIEAHGGWPGAFQTGKEEVAEETAPHEVIPFKPRTIEPQPHERYKACVPLVPLKIAAGAFGDPQHIQDEAFEWVQIETGHRLRPGMFVAQVDGQSMEPLIPDGSYCLFRSPVEGSRQGKTVLVELEDRTDPETGERYTIKRYESEKANRGESWHHARITLKPVNPDFEQIVLIGTGEEQLQVVAELVEVLEGET